MDIVAIGEMLIDFICEEKGETILTAKKFSKKAGGAPANVAVAVSRLGGKASFVGKVGDDSFGHFLKNTLEKEKVDTSNMILDKKCKTSLAFVSLKNDGERDFEFIREPGADTMLEYDEIDINKIMNSKIIHYGSISFIKGKTKNTLLKILKEAKDKNILLSYDPNIRLNLWENKIKALKWILKGVKYADIIKVSEEELEFITNKKDLKKGIKFLHNKGIKIVFVTRGKNGAICSNGECIIECEGLRVNVLDTTGAGDGFTGGYLYKISKYKDFKEVFKNEKNLREIVEFANKVGALTTTEYGAIEAMPTLDKVIKL